MGLLGAGLVIALGACGAAGAGDRGKESGSGSSATQGSGGASSGTSGTDGTGAGILVPCMGMDYPADAVADMGTFGMEVVGDGALADLVGVRCLVGGGVYVREVTNLSALASLERVSGGFAITDSPGLITLEGLGSLAHVGGNLVVDGNPDLVDLEALDGLVSVQGILQLGRTTGNDAMVALPALSALVQVDYLAVSENDNLTSLGDPPSVMISRGVAFANDPRLPHEDAVAWAETLVSSDKVLVCGCLGSPAGPCMDPGPAGS